MGGAHAFLQNLALVLCVAGLTTVVFHRLRLPVVFGYLLAGLIVGPNLPIPLVADEGMVRTLSELGVILLMYSLGLEFSVRRLVQIGGVAGLTAFAETTVMFGLGWAMASALGWTPLEQLFTGAIVAISSTTIIAKSFAARGVTGPLRELVFGILIVEDLIAILLVAVLSAVATGSGVSAEALAITGVRLATFLLAIVGFGLVVLPRLMRYVVSLGSDETTTVTGIGLAFAAALLALAFGYSVALGAFLAGSLVAESGHGHRVERLIAPVRDMFVAIFFVAVGMLIDPAVLVAEWPAILALVALVLVGKIVAVATGAFLTGNGLRGSVRAGMSLAQIGEFSFIIAGVGVTAGATRPFLYPVAIAVSAVTTLTTPWLVGISGRAAHELDRRLPRALQTYAALYGSWIERIRTAPAERDRLQVRRLVRLVLLDVALLAGLVVAAGAEVGRLTVLLERSVGLSTRVSRWTIVALAIVASIPFVVGLVRMSRLLATVLAARALPAPTARGIDRAAAPRGALVATLQFAILLAAAVPLVALLQPFLPRVPVFGILAALGLLLGVAVWQSAGDLYGHARAGAEVIVMALLQHDRAKGTDAELTRTMESVAAMLPGLGEPEPVRLGEHSPAVGRTLGELDLRGATGATVLAITRVDGEHAEAVIPSGRELLRAGDVLALAGTHEAIAAAKEMLVG